MPLFLPPTILTFSFAIKNDQAAVGANVDIVWATATGTIAFATPSWTLIGGKTYLLNCQLAVSAFNGGATFITYQWVDAANVAVGTNCQGLREATITNFVEATSLYTPVANTAVKVRTTSISGGSVDFQGGFCSATIMQLA